MRACRLWSPRPPLRPPSAPISGLGGNAEIEKPEPHQRGSSFIHYTTLLQLIPEAVRNTGGFGLTINCLKVAFHFRKHRIPQFLHKVKRFLKKSSFFCKKTLDCVCTRTDRAVSVAPSSGAVGAYFMQSVPRPCVAPSLRLARACALGTVETLCDLNPIYRQLRKRSDGLVTAPRSCLRMGSCAVTVCVLNVSDRWNCAVQPRPARERAAR